MFHRERIEIDYTTDGPRQVSRNWAWLAGSWMTMMEAIRPVRDGWGLGPVGPDWSSSTASAKVVSCVRTVLLTGVYCANVFAKNSNRISSGARENSEMVRATHATVCDSM